VYLGLLLARLDGFADETKTPSIQRGQAGCSILLAVQSEDILMTQPPPADTRLAYGPDPNQFVDVRFPQGAPPHSVVFFIHGGYWRAKYDLTYAGHLCHALKQAGVGTWNVEYRRIGNPGGGWPGSFEDIRNAYRALVESQQKDKNKIPSFDLKRLCVAGHSAGGQLALCLAAHENSIQRVLSLAGVLDLRRGWELHLSDDAVSAFLGGSPSEVPDHYHEASPAALSIPQATQKLIHGVADDSVPYEIGKSYAERKKKIGENVELATLLNTGHFEIVDPRSTAWRKVLDVFLTLTKG
jgi:acetyl esterase/lipase